MKKSLILLLLIVGSMTSCGVASKAVKFEGTVTRDAKYDGAVITFSPEEFFDLGFELGDSVDVVFENGPVLKDIPFYNGYYVKRGSPLLVAYPGLGDVRVTYNNLGFFTAEGLKEGCRVTVTVNTPGKYADIHESLGQQYSFSREDYQSDEQFTNFRALSGGKLKDGLLFRGSSPIDNVRGRAPYADRLLEEWDIRYIVDLSDTGEELAELIERENFTSPCTEALYESGRIVPLGLSADYSSETYHRAVVKGLLGMLSSDGPVYIHCLEGKDRTGFVCMLLEALAGASYEEMLADYMATYDNYFGITEKDTPDKYDAIAELYFDGFMEYLHGEGFKTAEDLSRDAANYLSDGGMSDDQLRALMLFLTGSP